MLKHVDVIAPDCDRFPMDVADRSAAEGAGVRLVEMKGHGFADYLLYRDTAAATLVWGGKFDRAMFEALPHLRVVARCGAGYDNVDLAEARARGVVVTTVPGLSSEEVAEHTIALLLGWARNLVLSDRHVRAGVWPSPAQLAPMRRVQGSTLGLVGLGRIAERVAVRAQGLGLSVIAHDPYVADGKFTTMGVPRCSALGALLEASDYVSLHVPLSDGSRRLIGARELAQMRRHSVLINTSRGDLVDTAALVSALRDEKIAGAALDVFETEPLSLAHPLTTMDRVILTPHSAAYSDQSLADIRGAALADSFAVLAGREPKHRIV